MGNAEYMGNFVCAMYVCGISTFAFHHLLGLGSTAVVYILYAGAFCKLTRKWQRQLASTYATLEAFEVQNAICFDESDRPKVEAIIEAFMKAEEFVAMDVSKDNALMAFNV